MLPPPFHRSPRLPRRVTFLLPFCAVSGARNGAWEESRPVSKVTVLVEAIGGPKLTIEVDRDASVEDIATAAAEATGRSLVDDDGAPHKWRLFTPTAKGGFAPAKPDLALGPVLAAMEGLRDRGEDGGFAGPGEHEGTTYLFRVRLFVPKPVEAGPPPEKPPPIEDEEAIDLTNLNEDHDELQTVRNVPAQARSTRRTRTVKRGDAPKKRRRKKTAGEGPQTLSQPGTPEPATPTQEAKPSVDELGPAAAPPATDPVEAAAAHKAVVATQALAARTPVPGDTAITAPSVSDEPGPSPQEAAPTDRPTPPRGPRRPDSSPIPALVRPGAQGEPPPPADPAEGGSSADDPKKAPPAGVPKKARSTGIPKKARSTGIPKKARSTGIPKKARSTGIPKKARSTGIPKKARSTGVPGRARSTGIPKKAGASRAGSTMSGAGRTGGGSGGGRRAEKGGGGMGGLLLALVVLAGVIGAFVMVLVQDGDKVSPEATPTTSPASKVPPRLADQILISPYPTAESSADADPVLEAIKAFNGIGARSAADLAQPARLSSAQASAETLQSLCDGTGRFDACDAASRTAFAAYLGCVGVKCPTAEAGAWFLRAAEMETRALDALKGVEDRAARSEALKLVALHSVRMGGQSMRVLTAKAPRLANLATTSCGAGAMAIRPDCQGVLAN